MSMLKLDPDFKPAFDGPLLAQELINKVLKSLPVMAAYLFGSSAIGKNTSDSDLDILLVVPDSSDLKKYYALVNSPFFSEVAVDWIIKTESEFERSQSLGGVTMVATQTGIRLKTDG